MFIRKHTNRRTVQRSLGVSMVSFAGLVALATLSLTGGCKDPAPTPKPLPTPSAPGFSSPTLTPVATTPAADARCAQTDAWVCDVPAELIALCNEKETDKLPCADKVWPKSLYDRILTLKNVELEACKATTLFVATQEHELLLRDQPSPGANIIGDGAKGSSVTCVGIVKGADWTKVKTPGGQEGFMSSTFLSATKTSGGSGGGGNTQACKDPDGDGFCVCWRWKYEPGEREVDIRWGNSAKSCAELSNKPFYPGWGIKDDKRVTVGCRENPDPGMLKEKDCLCQIRLKETTSERRKTCPAGWNPE